VAAFYLVAITYFALSGRHKLVLSPEEEFAVTRGHHGHPETEGYGRTHVGEAQPEAPPDVPSAPETAT
jgi:ethanolamine permease